MSALFSPFQLGSLRLRNRVVMPPMVSGQSDLSGAVSGAIVEHYRLRARAGTGTIIVEATNVDEAGRPWSKGIGAWEDGQVAGLTALAQAIHEQGAMAAIQLVHGGPQASSEIPGVSVVGPSTVPHSAEARPPRALTVEQIVRIEERFADAAARCAHAGFDAVEAHGAHGYLLDSFLSAHSNRRTDEYGGTIAGRMRMLLETCRKMKDRIGDRALICRISLFNKPEGFGLDEYRELLRGLESAGIDILHVSTDGAFKPFFGSEKSLGQWTKEISAVPVIVAGGLGAPADAGRAVAEGHCDLAAIGSAMYEDPEWTAKARRALGA
jgi:2,4-dienoyl-CoA reductase-like NADH-dependent reductase (Old Yellow Enzyme family)